jgi:hypothetical protein
MRWREFIAFVAGAAAAYPARVHGQQLRSLQRIGYVTPTVGRNTVDDALESSP